MLIQYGKNEENQLFPVFFGTSNYRILAFKIKIPNDWTPQFFLGVLAEEAKSAHIISLLHHVIQYNGATDDIFNVRKILQH